VPGTTRENRPTTDLDLEHAIDRDLNRALRMLERAIVHRDDLHDRIIKDRVTSKLKQYSLDVEIAVRRIK
jgi:hypothetical protein